MSFERFIQAGPDSSLGLFSMGCDTGHEQCGTPSRRALFVESLLGCWARLGSREHKGREVHYRLINGVEDLLAAADGVVAVAGQTIGACPNFGRGRKASSA